MDDEVVGIGENEHPKSGISPVMIEKDLVLGNSNGIFSLACLYSFLFYMELFVSVWLLHFLFPNLRDLKLCQKWPWSHIVVDMQ